MDVHIGEMDTTVRAVDDRSLLSPDVLDAVAEAVVARLEQRHRLEACAARRVEAVGLGAGRQRGGTSDGRPVVTVLAKARFHRLATPSDSQGRFLDVQYNPTELTFTKAAQVAEIPIPGLDTPLLQYVRGQAETVSVELFFDATEDGTSAEAKPVTKKTDKFYELIKAEKSTHAPPVLLFTWGGTAFPGNRRDGFRCVVTSVRQQFTMFAPNGVPLRAKLTVDLKEYKPLTLHLRELGFLSADHTKATVAREGDTISAIAYREYGDAREWRRVADENRITDPLALRAGAVLRIPKGVAS